MLHRGYQRQRLPQSSTVVVREAPTKKIPKAFGHCPFGGGVKNLFRESVRKGGFGYPQIRKFVSAKNKSVKEGVGLPPKTVNHKNGAFGVFSRLAARKISFSVRKGGSRGTLLREAPMKLAPILFLK